MVTSNETRVTSSLPTLRRYEASSKVLSAVAIMSVSVRLTTVSGTPPKLAVNGGLSIIPEIIRVPIILKVVIPGARSIPYITPSAAIGVRNLLDGSTPPIVSASTSTRRMTADCARISPEQNTTIPTNNKNETTDFLCIYINSLYELRKLAITLHPHRYDE